MLSPLCLKNEHPKPRSHQFCQDSLDSLYQALLPPFQGQATCSIGDRDLTPRTRLPILQRSHIQHSVCPPGGAAPTHLLVSWPPGHLPP